MPRHFRPLGFGQNKPAFAKAVPTGSTDSFSRQVKFSAVAEYQSILTDKFDRAWALARVAHQHQRYRTGEDVPYEAHLMGVAALVLKCNGTEDEAIAAVLHDVLEDQAEAFGGLEKTREKIQTEFGQNVLDIVDGCTDKPGGKSQEGQSWRESKQPKLDALRNHASPSVRLVTLADKCDNLSAIIDDYQLRGPEIWQNFAGGGGAGDRVWFFKATARAIHDAERNINREHLSLPEQKRYDYRYSLLIKLNTLAKEFEALHKSTFFSSPN